MSNPAALPFPSWQAPATPAAAVTAPAPDLRGPAPRSYGGSALGAFVGFESWSSAKTLAPLIGLAGRIERARADARIGVTADAAWRAGFDDDSSGARVDVVGGVGHVALTLGRRFEGVGTGRVSIGPGVVVDRVHATRTTAGGQVSAPTRTDADLALGLRLRWDVALGPSATAFALAGADVVTVASHYTETIDGVTSVVATSWPVRPVFALGVSWGAE